ncbi:DUF4041 domain-containing protein [Marinobacter subterrani]|nr:DUF4041 domain-containing protein [Marinobacter subterrani]
MIGAFNAEVDLARSKIRRGSYDTAINKLEKSVTALEKLAETVNVLISPQYLQAKEEELEIRACARRWWCAVPSGRSAGGWRSGCPGKSIRWCCE